MRGMEADCWRVEALCGSHRTWRSVALKRAEPGFLFSDGSHPKGTAMNRGPTALAAALTLGGSFANAQSGAPSGAGSAIGDPPGQVPPTPVRRRLRAVRSGSEARFAAPRRRRCLFSTYHSGDSDKA